ncbi:uncharacterized protein PRCAT00005768001 [Priceomyces carsonii]|uniref:uncharacterized protein n=1 Tax=Priceomyces carsonii TaxID=28549 RepID=UPI002ED8D006|nr:unnamed protein product [Priceomyces carsonii]
MSLKFTNSKKAAAPIAPYSHAVEANGFLYLSGFGGLDVEGKLVGNGDVKVETKQVLENIKNVIEEAGSDFKNIVKVNIFITDMSKYKELNEIYALYFTDNKPARSCIEVKSIPIPNGTVEIEVVVLV